MKLVVWKNITGIILSREVVDEVEGEAECGSSIILHSGDVV